MNQYANPYFDIRIDFPDIWSFRYWGNRTNTIEFPEQYQTAFDDLPSESSREKELLSARSSIRRNSILGTGLHIVSLYRPSGFSLLEYRAEFESDLKREFQTQLIDGVEIQSLFLEEQGDGFIWYSKLYCWEHAENIWLFFGIRSDSAEGYEEARKVISQLSKCLTA